ncbi:interferon-induced very large GTPase 1-like isoform X2 [Ambystoma mexicanum]
MPKEIPDGKTQEDSREKGLVEKLNKLGLNRAYWLQKLQVILGIDNPEALQYTDHDDYQKLEQHVQHLWEKRALKKLLNVPYEVSTLNKVQAERCAVLQKRQEQAKVILSELQQMHQEGRERQDGVCSRKEEELRKAMEIPREYWVPSWKPLHDMIETLHKELPLQEASFVKRDGHISDQEILRNASGGLALEGIYKTTKLEDYLVKRETLLIIPEGFVLRGPEQSPVIEQKEFSSSFAESTFMKSMDKLGYSMNCTAKGSFLGIQMETSPDYRKSSESDTNHKSNHERSYFSTTKYNYIPVASCYFEMDQVRLSAAALQELTNIEQLLSLTKDEEDNLINRGIESFFCRFGSHANQGPLHFGGIFWWKASSEGFKAEDVEEVKNMTNKALQGRIGPSFCTVGATVGGSHEKSAGSARGKDMEVVQKQIQVVVAKTGGPVEVDSLTQWKAGLVSNNKTWCLIDRGYQLVPVWDIILNNHKSEFKDVQHLCTNLLEAYETLTNQKANILPGLQYLCGVNEAKMFLNDVKTWQVSSAEENLKKLMDFKQHLNEKVKNYSVWNNVCLADPALQDYLVRVVEECKESQETETVYIKYLMRALVDPHIQSVDKFPKSSVIERWIYESEKEQRQQISISGLDEFVQVLQKAKKDIMEARCDATSSAATIHESRINVNVNVSLSLYSFLRVLRKSKQIEKELLFLLIANSAGYDVKHHTFRYILGMPEIDFMVNELKKANTEYMSLLEQNPYRAQAYILQTGLTSDLEDAEVFPEQKKERLTLMKEYLAGSLLSEVESVLKGHDNCGDWDLLEKDLNALTLGNIGEANHELKSQQAIEELESLRQGVKPYSPSAEDPIDNQEMHNTFTNQAFLKVLKRLNLEKYYPKKMKVSDFHIIAHSAFYDSPPTSESKLPFYFFQKLLMLDYRARYVVCKEDGIGSEASNKDVNTRDGTGDSADVDDFFNNVINVSSDAAPEQKSPLHPMDVQMAIFHCADNFVRQYIATKLSFCQFALPLLVPNPCTSQLEFPLWSLRQVKKKWKNKTNDKDSEEKRCKNSPVSTTQTPFVSFIRFRNSPASKSQILNHLLSKQKHSIFFNRHCSGSSKDCLLMDGVVDVAWYCPGGNNDDRFDECIAFTNLHGDARDHEKQVAFLHEISAVNVILMSDTDCNDKAKHILQKVFESKTPVVFLLADKEHTKVDNSRIQVKIAIKNRNEAQLISELSTQIQRLLKISNKAGNMEECARTAEMHGFLIDENAEQCKQGKKRALELLTVLKKKELREIKETFLSLQGELWHDWCKKDKELRRLRDRMNKSIEQQKSDIESALRSIRHSQLRRAFPLNDLMRSFIHILQSSSHSEKMYFLQWLRLFLDDLTSGPVSELHQQFHCLWSKMLADKKNEKKENSGDENVLNKLRKEINDCIFGLEHFLREIGQIYEALDSLSENKHFSSDLTEIAADLMVSGYPIELMDGDAAHVPTKWIDAVLDKVIEKLGDKKLYVLSVLGIQSTGKSTLLNAMFGLQFAVSAGKCTRGAFMQLIKVDDKLRTEMNFDYLLVIDTEGLRSPEAENSKSPTCDNELATFVIGLGNMTLINIYGENPCEMQNILEIAVQAFLRMRKVKLSPSCLFVHQNVGEITAKEKNMEGRRSLQKKLDEMTLIAAQQERCDVKCFNDVIRFDVNTQIHYFAHLWEGDGPMAPPSPSYSENVQDLKRVIFTSAKQHEDGKPSIVRISDLKLRINDLWSALLDENFVFSFKNSLEITTYDRLEKMYNSWNWDLKKHFLGLQDQLTVDIGNNKNHVAERAYIAEQVQQEYETIQMKLEKFFKEDNHSEILVQWRGRFETRLHNVMNENVESTMKMCREQISQKSSENKMQRMKLKYKSELQSKSKKLALDLKGKGLGKEALREQFDHVWNDWHTKIASSAPRPERPNIIVDMQNTLLEQFENEPHIKESINSTAKWTNFTDEFSEYYSPNRKWFFSLKAILGKSEKDTIRTITTALRRGVNEYLTKKEAQKQDYQCIYFSEILNTISEETDKMFQGLHLKFKQDYKVYISCFLCYMAAKRFEKMSDIFQITNDPIKRLESEKESLFELFSNFCQETNNVTTLANLLFEQLKNAIAQGVYKTTAIDIAGEMRSNCPAFNGNRSNLENHLLISLAEEENFEKYVEYIEQPKEAFKRFIENNVVRYCSDKNKSRLHNAFNITLDSFKAHFIRAFASATNVANNTSDKKKKLSSWLHEFCKIAEERVEINKTDLKDLEDLTVTDIHFINQAMTNALDAVDKQLKKEFSEHGLTLLNNKPQEIMCEHLSGCWVQCPFCTAVCTNTLPGHDGQHSLCFHRPQALANWNWNKTTNFVVEFCTTHVGSDLDFLLPDGRRIPYRKYPEAGPKYACWNIKPDTSMQSYWKWFVCHFRSKLEKHCGNTFSGMGTIPPQWFHLSKETAIEELKK